MDDDYESRVPREEKTNWKDEIRRALVFPKFVSHHPVAFMDAVESAVNIVANSYPGWDAFKEVNEEIAKIKVEYKKKYDDWLSEHETNSKNRKYLVSVALNVEMNKKIWTFLRNYVAKKGMLSEGPRDSRSIKYEDD